MVIASYGLQPPQEEYPFAIASSLVPENDFLFFGFISCTDAQDG
jgi:hypothetical protein